MDLRRPRIIGHSMGGTLAMMLAARYPASTGKVMVVDLLPSGAGMVGGTTSGMGVFAGQLGSYFTGIKAGGQMVRQLGGSTEARRVGQEGARRDRNRRERWH